MTLRVSAREANQKFSEILNLAAGGEPVVITRRGEPVAQLVRFGAGSLPDDQAAAWDRLTSALEAGLPLGGTTFERDALYER